MGGWVFERYRNKNKEENRGSIVFLMEDDPYRSPRWIHTRGWKGVLRTFIIIREIFVERVVVNLHEFNE